MVKKAIKEEVAAVPVAPVAEVLSQRNAKEAKTAPVIAPPAVSEKKASTKKEEKKVEVVEINEGEEVNEAQNGIESQTVLEKKENARKMLKAVKSFNANLKSSIERKDITRAVQALQAYYKKVKSTNASGTKQLLEKDDQHIQVTFTLTQAPQRPTPRPLEITVPHPFQGVAKEHDTRVCVFVKDPSRAFKD